MLFIFIISLHNWGGKGSDYHYHYQSSEAMLTGVQNIIISLQKQGWEGSEYHYSLETGVQNIISVTGNKGGKGSEYHYQSSETKMTGVQNSVISHRKQR